MFFLFPFVFCFAFRRAFLTDLPPFCSDSPQREDPYYEAFGAHFRNLFERYGAPIIVLNLMKRREKRRFELALSEGYERGLVYLSQVRTLLALPSSFPSMGPFVLLF